MLFIDLINHNRNLTATSCFEWIVNDTIANAQNLVDRP